MQIMYVFILRSEALLKAASILVSLNPTLNVLLFSETSLRLWS